ncbi:hypothetical protein Esi_0148_0039 [Ectocarpus siliculosus]|uniref:Uncharacterized protein n=1 Tax=Ectocarpus siliculosus TaxID=2880 RepID=D8LFD8_ECTSI|nr:hypothetical protein Esi_0148_0039 [Ectocarpus siliculosus]|eukprot:CBN75598.1 hypothetical protein Esi_0148_0039 [Ectocarpus siliculosus]
MAGASSLQDDILALVKKHSDTCLPEDLLARVSEDARLLAAKMKIRSLHEEDPFGLFSDGRDEEGAENGGGGEGARKVPSTDELPDNVLRMLEGMKINRLDKSSIKGEKVPDSSNLVPRSQVAALNGFTTIDAEVEFSRTGTDSTATAAASAGTDGPALTSAAATRGKPTLSEGTVAAAARAAAAAGGKATTGEEDKGTSSDEDDDDDHDDDAESPVFLTFRFRREPLRSGPAEPSRGEGGRAVGGGDARDHDHQEAGEVIDLALDDDEDDDEEEEPSAVISTTPKGDNEGGSLFEKKGSATAVPAKIAAGKDVSCDGGGGGGGDSHGKEGRKRAGSRGRESEEGRGGNDKGRKRPKGGEEEEVGEEEDEGADDEEGGKQGVNGDAKQCEEDDEGLDYEPRTLVSYSISGGIGYDAPATLLQALVYARGDGPACVMPPPKPKKGDDDVDDNDNDDEEEGEEEGGSACNDQEDVFDCDVNGPALAALGRALGLHTEDPPTSDSDSDSASDDGGDVRMKDSGARPSASAKGPEKEPDTADGEPGKGIGSMTQSDLVWWLLLFPFFEKEFDVVEVVASSVFGEDDLDDSDDGGGEASDPEA